MNKIELAYNKTLKLSNVLIFEIKLNEETNIDREITQMENFIKSKGAIPIGPLIQKTVYQTGESGEPVIRIYLMRQVNTFIYKIESPYTMESVIRVRNCAYVRYTGPEEKIKFGYDKINVDAFEKGIELANENFTIFVDKQDDTIIADIFVEKKSDD